MAEKNTAPSRQTLQHLSPAFGHQFATPVKCINDGDDLQFFFGSTAYRDLMTWLLQLNRAIFPIISESGKITAWTLDGDEPMVSSEVSLAVDAVRTVLTSLGDLISDAPPDTTTPRRFGNIAFRKWYQLATESVPRLLDTLIQQHLRQWIDGQSSQQQMTSELQAYLLGSFGSAQRLDYGTGHELSFVAFLGCLWKLGTFSCSADPKSECHAVERTIVLYIVQPYLDLVRKLITTYTLEPAGSHGVWGLDDHSFVPYIFGSAQFGPPIGPRTLATPTEGSLDHAPPPSSITSHPTVNEQRNRNMYFSAIQFIYDVKRGPFWEHSPILYDVSGIKDGWAKINKGMLKMYAAEVLGKFPVVQHFPFGGLFAWAEDPQANTVPRTMHSMQQPKSKDVPIPPFGAATGTQAPWSRQMTAVTAELPVSERISGSRTARNAPVRNQSTTMRTQAATSHVRAAPTSAPWPKR